MPGRQRFAMRAFLLAGLHISAHSGVAADSPEPTVVIRGTVVTEAGTPVAGARVFAVYQPQYRDYAAIRATTDDRGQFEIDKLPARSRIGVYALADGFAMGAAPLVLDAAVAAANVDVVLRPAGLLMIDATDPSGRPLVGAFFGELTWDGPNGRVRLDRHAAARLGIDWPRSNDLGRLESRLLPAGATVSGHVWHSRFSRAPFHTTITSRGTTPPTTQLGDAVDFTLQVVGNGVATPANGLQLSMFRDGDDAHYFLDEPVALNPQGEFHAALPPGLYRGVMLRHPELQTVPGLISNFEVAPGKAARIEIALTPRGIVRGRVVYAGSNEPIAGRTIEAFVDAPEHPADCYGLGPGWYYSARATTDERGNYTIRPGVGSVRLFLAHETRYVGQEPFLAVPNVSADRETAASDYRLVDLPTLKGVVTDADGKPVSRAVLQPAGEQYWRHPFASDSNGRFEFRVAEITRDEIFDATGYIELSVFDPFRPLGRRLKIALDPRHVPGELTIRLEPQPFPALPTPVPRTDGQVRLAVGTKARELAFQKAFGAGALPLRMADQRGKFVLLHFWATWCGPCKYDMPRVELARDLYSDRGLVVIGVHHNSVPADAVQKFIEQNGPHHVHVLDSAEGDTCQRYGVESFPSYVLVDPEGIIVATSMDESGALRFELVPVLRRLLCGGNQAD